MNLSIMLWKLLDRKLQGSPNKQTKVKTKPILKKQMQKQHK